MFELRLKELDYRWFSDTTDSPVLTSDVEELTAVKCAKIIPGKIVVDGETMPLIQPFQRWKVLQFRQLEGNGWSDWKNVK